MATPDETLIINYLTDLFSWNGTTRGQPRTITFFEWGGCEGG